MEGGGRRKEGEREKELRKGGGRRERAEEKKNITRVHQSHKGSIVSFTCKVLDQNEFETNYL